MLNRMLQLNKAPAAVSGYDAEAIKKGESLARQYVERYKVDDSDSQKSAERLPLKQIEPAATATTVNKRNKPKVAAGVFKNSTREYDF